MERSTRGSGASVSPPPVPLPHFSPLRSSLNLTSGGGGGGGGGDSPPLLVPAFQASIDSSHRGEGPVRCFSSSYCIPSGLFPGIDIEETVGTFWSRGAMDVVCELCGAIGYKHLLVQCNNCKDSNRHRYCMDTIVYGGPSIEWLCDDCLPKHNEPMESLEAFSNQREQDHIQLDPYITNGSYVDGTEVVKELRSWGRRRCRSRMAKKTSNRHFLNGDTFKSKIFNGKLLKCNNVEKEAKSTSSPLIDSTKCVGGSNYLASIPTSEIKENNNVRKTLVGFEPTMNSMEGLDLSKEEDCCFPTKYVEVPFPQGTNGDSLPFINDVERTNQCVDNSSSILPTMEKVNGSSDTAESVEQPHPLEVVKQDGSAHGVEQPRPLEMVKPDGSDHLALDPALESTENVCIENATSSSEPTLNSILSSVEKADGSSHMKESVEQPYPLEVVKPDSSYHSTLDPALEREENIGIENAVDSIEPSLNSMECVDLSKEKYSCTCSSKVAVGSITQGVKTGLFPSRNDVEHSHSSVFGSRPTIQSEGQVDGSCSILDSLKQPHPLEVIPSSDNMPTSIQGSESLSNYSQLAQGSDQNIGNYHLKPSEVLLDSRSMSKAADPSCFSKGQDGSNIGKDGPDSTEFVAPAFDNLKGSNLSMAKECLVSNVDNSDEVNVSEKHLLCATDNREQGQSKVTSHQNIAADEVVCTVLNGRSSSWKMNENSNPKSTRVGNLHRSNIDDGVRKISVHADKNVTCKKALQTEGVNSEVLPPETVSSCKETKISSEKEQNQPNKPNQHLAENPKSKIRKKQKGRKADDDGNTLPGSPKVVCVQNDTAQLPSHDVLAKDQCSVSRMPVISPPTDQQCYIPTEPIDKPYWTGIMKIDREYISLAAHLSNKACKKVQEFSRSLPPVMKVMKHPKLEAWPSRWEESEPTDESIALYFFPDNMRPNKDLDRLVQYVTDHSIVLKYVGGEVKLLIFPSVFLPEKFQMVQGKHYLWGVFKRRKVMSKGDPPLKKQECTSQGANKRKYLQGKVQVDTLDQQMPGPSVKKQDCTSQVAKKRSDKQDKVQVDRSDQGKHARAKNKQDCTSQASTKRNNEQDKVQVDTLDQEKHVPSAKKQDNASQVAKKRKKQDKVPVDTLDQEKHVPSVKEQDPASQVTKKRKVQQDKVQVGPLNREKPVSKHDILNDNQPSSDTVDGVTAETKRGDAGKAGSSSEAPGLKIVGLIDLQTPRSQQLFEELKNEGARLLPVN